MNFRITEAARRIGVSPESLRRLNRKGVISVRRDWSGRRVFTETELANIEKILFPGVKEDKLSGLSA